MGKEHVSSSTAEAYHLSEVLYMGTCLPREEYMAHHAKPVQQLKAAALQIWRRVVTRDHKVAWASNDRSLKLVDCDTTDSGCNGGLMDFGFEYVIQHKGLCSEVEYPYTSGTTTKRGTCQSYNCDHRFDVITSYADVPSNTQAALESALCDGPVSIAIEADQSYFQFYSSGVLDGSGCGANLDHGVLLVGMGTDPTYGDYWKVKNSWGTQWGDAGYIRLCRNCGMNNGAGQCGLMKQPSYPVV